MRADARREVADEIIARNLGRVMNDGSLFDDPSLIRVGWQIEIPGGGPVDVADGAEVVDAAPIDPLLHTVVRGESYWGIAEDHLEATGQPAGAPEIAALTDALIDLNQPLLGHDLDSLIVPGDVVRWPAIEVVVPAAEPPAEVDASPASPTIDATPAPTAVVVPASTDAAPATQLPVLPPQTARTSAPTPGSFDPGPAETDHGTSHGAPIALSLGAATLLCAGALGLVESRRRHQMRRAPTDARLEPPTDSDVATERLLRTLPAVQRALRLDLALRSAGHHLAGTGAHVMAVTMTRPGRSRSSCTAPSERHRRLRGDPIRRRPGALDPRRQRSTPTS